MLELTENCLSGKRALVTGSTSGIGLATARLLAKLGARVTLVGRDPSRGEAALDLIRTASALDRRGAHLLELADLSSMKECAALGERIAAAGPLDILVNCAGAFTTRRTLTVDGFETQFAVNHLAAFVLGRALLPALEASGDGRFVIVSSDSHRPGRIHWSDPGFGRFYFGLRAYEQSKLANVLFARELAHRLGAESAVTVFALDPGLVDTAMGNKAGLSPSSLVWSLRRRAGTSTEVPAAAIAWLAATPQLKGRSGGYWKDGSEVEPSERARNDADARRLWDLSATMVSKAIGQGTW